MRLWIALFAMVALAACGSSGDAHGGHDGSADADAGAARDGTAGQDGSGIGDGAVIDGSGSADGGAARDGSGSMDASGALDGSISSDGGGAEDGSGSTDGANADAGGSTGDASISADAGSSDARSIADLSDEFNDPTTLSSWSINNVVQGTSPSYSTLDIDTSSPGHLEVIPTMNFWFNDEESTFIYKSVTGDFVMRTLVSAHSTTSSRTPPLEQYNGGGLMVRDPSSRTTPNSESWVIVTAGYQDQYVGLEDASTMSSLTSLNLRPGGFSFELVVCRIGSALHIFSRVPGEMFWQDLDDDVRPDLPATVQVGMAAQAFLPPPDVVVEWDYVRFAVPTMLSDCTVDIPPH